MKKLILVLLFLASVGAWFQFTPEPARAASAYKTDYELVSASLTVTLGVTGGQGDILERVIIVPETVGAGTVSIKDGSGSAINIFVSGTLSDLRTIEVPLGIRSASGAWQIITGANVHAIGIGSFK